MKRMKYLLIILTLTLVSCKNKSENQESLNPVKESNVTDKRFTLMTLDPGHFHASLVQKSMYDELNKTVYVYAPKGADVEDHLNRIKGYNAREENPTQWDEVVYTGDDYLHKMITEKPGNIIVVSGKNNRKIEYIKAAINAGIDVYADKPMVINTEDFKLLEQIFQTAAKKNLLIYDIMTERFEINTILQRELSMIPEVFGDLIDGTANKPAITKESVHHFFKYVSGKPLKRPMWFFDTKQRGEGINDVSTHLVDLVQWEAFPDQILKKSDIEILNAKHWTTELSKEMFLKVTGANNYPEYLKDNINNEILKIFCNGSITYKIKGKVARTSVTWNFKALEGAGDTHYSIMRGSLCDLIIQQGEEENYKPKLYIKLNSDLPVSEFENSLKNAVDSLSFNKYTGLKLQKLNDTTWTIDIPQVLKINHEGHFNQVTKNYLKYLKYRNIPKWEVPNMIVKYYTTSEAFKLANKK